jgi:hypothetical protein
MATYKQSPTATGGAGMSERAEMECKRCGDNEDRIDGFCSNECKDKYSLEAALSKMSIRIAELEAENNRLAELLHNELSSVEIATDLGNKRWTALNKIYEDGEKHNTNWCKRIAQEGLGIK